MTKARGNNRVMLSQCQRMHPNRSAMKEYCFLKQVEYIPDTSYCSGFFISLIVEGSRADLRMRNASVIILQNVVWLPRASSALKEMEVKANDSKFQ